MSHNPSTLAALAAVAALLAACSASAQNTASVEPMTAEPAFVAATAESAAPDAAVSCDVRSRRTANGLLIQARAFADRDIDGEYELVITKSGGGNSSEINQAGPVSLAAGESVALGESEISVERGARVRAVLALYDADGEICRRVFTL